MTDTAVPALYEHAHSVYSAMKEEAQTEQLFVGRDDEGLVYEGFLTKLVAGLGLSVPYYTSVMRALKDMGCVEQLRRGGSNSPSRWHLLREPTPEEFERADSRPHVTRAQAADQRYNDLIERINSMEEKVDILWDWWLENIHS